MVTISRTGVVFTRRMEQPNPEIFKIRPNFTCPKCQAEFTIGAKLNRSDYDGNGKSVVSPIICHKCNESVYPKRIEYVEGTKVS